MISNTPRVDECSLCIILDLRSLRHRLIGAVLHVCKLDMYLLFANQVNLSLKFQETLYLWAVSPYFKIYLHLKIMVEILVKGFDLISRDCYCSIILTSITFVNRFVYYVPVYVHGIQVSFNLNSFE